MIRVLTRILKKMKDELGINLSFTDHQRRAKKRMPGILSAKGEKVRISPYEDLLKVTKNRFLIQNRLHSCSHLILSRIHLDGSGDDHEERPERSHSVG